MNAEIWDTLTEPEQTAHCMAELQGWLAAAEKELTVSGSGVARVAAGSGLAITLNPAPADDLG